jgi:hypothetical protein
MGDNVTQAKEWQENGAISFDFRTVYPESA